MCLRAFLSLILTLVIFTGALGHTRSPDSPACGEIPGTGQQGYACPMGCCTDGACCTVPDQPQPQPIAPAVPHQRIEVDLVPLSFDVFSIVFLPPTPRPTFQVEDEVLECHELPPLVVNCIRLI